MSPWTVLLRVLLCVGLIFNGSGAAVASARMHLAHVQTAATQPDVRESRTAGARAETTAPCHGGAAMAGGQQLGEHHHSGSNGSEATAGVYATDVHATDEHSSDCCQSGACRCDCIHQAQLVVDVDWTRGEGAAHTNDVRSMRSAHVPPVLPHLIRPPIRAVS